MAEAKRRDLGGPQEEGGRAYYLPYTAQPPLVGELLHQCASQYDPTQQWVLPLLHQQQLLGPSSSAESGSGPLALTELQ